MALNSFETKSLHMEKILLVIDAVYPNKNALDFACYLGRLTRSKVTGVFLENAASKESPVLKQLHKLTHSPFAGDEMPEDPGSRHEELVEKNIARFKEGCICRDVNYNLHRDRGMPVEELVQESRFADIMVTDAAQSFQQQFEGIPSEFVRELLKKAECPVIIAPETFEPVKEIVFTYNGSPSSIFAIKQFTYLFPQFSNTKATIIQVNSNGEWHGNDKQHLKEWLNDHYTNLHFEAIKGTADTQLFNYLFNKKNMFLVMGAYGRNPLSEFFKPNPADMLIKTVTQAIFITHV
jgi:hypothetical protein